MTATETIVENHELRRFAIDETPRELNGEIGRRPLRAKANRRQQRLLLKEAAPRIEKALGEVC